MRRRSLLVASTAFALSALMVAVPARAADDAKGVIEAYLAAWNAHDSTRAASYFAEDVVYYDASVGTPLTGAAAAKTGVIDNFLNASPDALWTMRGAPVVEGDRIAFEWEFSGTNTGAWGDGTPATGKPFKFTGASVFEIKDGKISTQSDYYDALGFYKQLGLM